MKLHDPRLPAVERLAASRERLRGALIEYTAPPDPADEEPSMVMSALSSIPGVGSVIDAVRGWWANHPLHLATRVAGGTARSAMRPYARRNPYKLVLGAAAIGGLLYWIKPWRGLFRSALVAGVLPQIVARAMSQVPIEAWLASMASHFRGEGDPPVPPSAPAAGEATTPPAGGTVATGPTVEVPASPGDAAGADRPPGPLH